MRIKDVLLLLLICSRSFAATPDIEFSAPSGIALDLQLFAVGGDTLIETIDCTERTNKKGWYLAASDGAPTLSGTYAFSIMLDGTTTAIGGGYVTVADDESTYQPHLAPSQAAVTVGTVTLVDTTTTNTDMITGFATEAKQDIIDGIVDAIVADTNELQTDWSDGGRLDLILDTAAAGGGGDATAANQATIIGLLDTEVADILADTGTTLPSAITAAAGAVTLANGAHGGAAATLTLSDYSEFVGAADPAAIWNYNISAITTAGYAGDYLNNVTSDTVDVTIVGPVLETEALQLVYGDDYTNALGRRLEWSSTGWPDLTSATVVFSMREKRSQTVVMSAVAGSVIAAGAGEQTVGVEILAAAWATAQRDQRNYEYDVKATIGGKIVTLVSDTATVVDKVTP